MLVIRVIIPVLLCPFLSHVCLEISRKNLDFCPFGNDVVGCYLDWLEFHFLDKDLIPFGSDAKARIPFLGIENDDDHQLMN